MKEFQKLGKQDSAPSRDLDTFETPTGVSEVVFKTKELTSFCPVTNQPDFNEVILTFVPDKLCIESKSLKLYFQSYRDDRLFGEALAARIAQDVYDAIKPISVEVEVKQQIRGGLQMTAYSRK